MYKFFVIIIKNSNLYIAQFHFPFIATFAFTYFLTFQIYIEYKLNINRNYEKLLEIEMQIKYFF